MSGTGSVSVPTSVIGLTADVAVVGAGPVGMVAALALAHRGREVTVVEQGPDVVRSEWRGSTLHPPTVQMLAELDLADQALGGAVRVQRLTYGDLELDETVSFDFDLLDGLTPYPFRLQYEQYKLVRQLRAALNAHPRVDVRFDTAAVDLHQDRDHVSVELHGPSGRQTVRSAWVVAADGAHSTLRRLLAVGFPGFTYPFQSLVVATRFPFEDHLAESGPVGYWSGPYGRLSLIRTPDVWRAATSTRTPADVRDAPASPHPDLARNLELLLGRNAGSGDIELVQHQLYRSHQRLAGSFRCGRVLLAGDAAHLSSTTGGMGLNSGIHDAQSLALALTGPDPDAAASAYAENRRSVAEQVVQPATTANRQGADTTDRNQRRERLDRLAALSADQNLARAHLASASMLGIEH